MIYKKKGFFLTILIIIIFQTLIYINNTQKTSFSFLIWNFQEIKIGRIIVISFFSGLLISTILSNKKNLNFVSNYKKDYLDQNEDYEDHDNEEENKTEVDIPPQRDIRDTQPTISVNYRVIKNTGDNYSKYEDNTSDNQQYQDDWNMDDSDW